MTNLFLRKLGLFLTLSLLTNTAAPFAIAGSAPDAETNIGGRGYHSGPVWIPSSPENSIPIPRGGDPRGEDIGNGKSTECALRKIEQGAATGPIHYSPLQLTQVSAIVRASEMADNRPSELTLGLDGQGLLSRLPNLPWSSLVLVSPMDSKEGIEVRSELNLLYTSKSFVGGRCGAGTVREKLPAVACEHFGDFAEQMELSLLLADRMAALEDYQTYTELMRGLRPADAFLRGFVKSIVAKGQGLADALELLSRSDLQKVMFAAADGVAHAIKHWPDTLEKIQDFIAQKIDVLEHGTPEQLGMFMGSLGFEVATLLVDGPVNASVAAEAVRATEWALTSTLIEKAVSKAASEVPHLEAALARRGIPREAIRFAREINDVEVTENLQSVVDTAMRTGKGDLVLFKNGEARAHYLKHKNGFELVSGKPSYSLLDYLLDANTVLKRGSYSRQQSAYYRIIGGVDDAKIAIVGLERDGGAITTFFINDVNRVMKKAPDLGWEK